ncbi:MAG: hypothetical protein U9Q34_06445, partial [Elusimicrobiota bacterium]|nr:hypothetical protein [Elusimicrobiota bacterium]
MPKELVAQPPILLQSRLLACAFVSLNSHPTVKGARFALLRLGCKIHNFVTKASCTTSSKIGKLFFVKKESKLDFENTIKKIRANINSSSDWTLQSEKDFAQNYDKSNKKLPFRLYEYKIGNPEHSFRVNSIFPAVATFMPASIA